MGLEHDWMPDAFCRMQEHTCATFIRLSIGYKREDWWLSFWACPGVVNRLSDDVSHPL